MGGLGPPQLSAQTKSVESERRPEAEVRDLTHPGPKAQRTLFRFESDNLIMFWYSDFILYYVKVFWLRCVKVLFVVMSVV